MLKLSHVKKTFNRGTVTEKRALTGVDLTLADGDFVTVIGGNGAGKSTLLNMIAGVYPLDSGTVELDGEDISRLSEPKRAKYLGRVFQDPMRGTAADMQIEENLALAKRRGQRRTLRWGITRAEREEYAELLKKLDLGLETRMQAKVGLLSGGQRQALTLLMATLTNPRVLLLDEPFAAIDAKIRKELRAWLKQTVRQLGVTSIFVTHDQEEAIEVADSIILTHAGRVEQAGAPAQIYAKPRTAFAASFFGDSVEVADASALGSFAAGPGIVRSEHVSLTAEGEPFRYAASTVRGTVADVAFRGRSVEVEVDVSGERLRSTRSPEAPALHPGDEVGVFVYRLFAEGPDGSARAVENGDLREESVVI